MTNQNPTPPVSYDCKCLKCGKDYKSKNKEDLDGDGFCLPCYEASQAIARKVDAQIALNRANNTPAIPVSFEPNAQNGQSGFMGIQQERIINT